MNPYFLSIAIVCTLVGNTLAQSNKTTMNTLDRIEDLMMDKGKPQAALEELQKMVKTSPEHYRIYLLIGLAYDQLNESLQAEVFFKKALELGKKQPDTYLEYGNFLVGVQRSEEALKLYKQGIAQIPKNARLHYMAGIVYDEQKKLPEALHYFEQAVNLEPTNPHYYYSTGAALRDMNKLSEALKAFDKCVDLDKKKGDPTGALAITYSTRARIKDDLKDYKGALADYQEAFRLNPDDYTEYNLESYKSHVAYLYYSDFEAWKEKDVAKAREFAQKALKWATKDDDDIREDIKEFEEEQADKQQIAKVRKAQSEIQTLITAKKYQQALPLAEKHLKTIQKLYQKYIEQYDLYLLYEAINKLYLKCKQNAGIDLKKD